MKTRNIWIFAAVLCIHIITIFPIAFAMQINFETHVSTNSARINWTTDELSLGWVNYTSTPEDPSSYKSETSEGGAKTSHGVKLESLQQATTYSYAISAEDAQGVITRTQTMEFTTIEVDSTPPSKVEGFSAAEIEYSSLKLEWEAVPETDVDHYELFKNGTSWMNVSYDTLTHTDQDVEENSKYNYAIRAVDTSGNAGQKTELEVETPNFVAFEIESVTFEVRNLQVLVSWLTSTSTSSVVYWGESPTSLTNKVENNETEISHNVVVQTEKPGTIHYFKVESCDADDCLESDVYNFTTGTDTVLFMNITNYPGLKHGATMLYNSDLIDINGFTKPYTFMALYVNDMNQAIRSTEATPTGDFSFGDIPLETETDKQPNKLRFALTDTNKEHLIQEFNLMVDVVPPLLNITSEVPPFVYNPNFQIDAVMNEDGNVSVKVIPAQLPELGSISNITVKQKGGDFVDLEWADVKDEGRYLRGYLMYVNDMPVDLATTSGYRFENLLNKTQYNLGIAPVDRLGNIRDKATITVTTKEEGKDIEDLEPYDLTQLLPNRPENVYAEDNLRYSIELANGVNAVEITATDLAGNQYTRNFSIIYDAEPPEPEITFPQDGANIYEIPAMDISVEGSLNDPDATIYLYVDCQLYKMATKPYPDPLNPGKYLFRFDNVNLLKPNVILTVGNVTGGPAPPSGSLFDIGPSELLQQDSAAETIAIDTHNLIDVDSWNSWEARAPSAKVGKVPKVFPSCTAPTTVKELGREYDVKANIVAIDTVGRVGYIDAQYHIKNCLSGQFDFVPQIKENRKEPTLISARRIEAGVERIGFYVQFEYIGDDKDVYITGQPSFRTMVDDAILQNKEPYKTSLDLIAESPSTVVPLTNQMYYVTFPLRRNDNMTAEYIARLKLGKQEKKALLSQLKFPIQAVIQYRYTDTSAPAYGGSGINAPGAMAGQTGVGATTGTTATGAPGGYPGVGVPAGYDPNAYSQQQYGSGYGYPTGGTYTSPFRNAEQTICFEVSYPVDAAQVNWAKSLPDWLLYDTVDALNTTLHWLNTAIEFMDEYIITYVLYACVFSLLAKTAWGIYRRIACHYSLKASSFKSFASKLSSGGNNKPNNKGGIYCPGSETTLAWQTECRTPKFMPQCFSDNYNQRLLSASTGARRGPQTFSYSSDGGGLKDALGKFAFDEKYVSDYELYNCFPSCYSAWHTEQSLYKLYRFFCDRVWCSSTPSGWTEGMDEDKLMELRETQNENRCDVDDGSVKGVALRGLPCNQYMKAPYDSRRTYNDLINEKGTDSQGVTILEQAGTGVQVSSQTSWNKLGTNQICYEYNYNNVKALYVKQPEVGANVHTLVRYLAENPNSVPLKIQAIGTPPNLEIAYPGSCQQLCNEKGYSGYACVDKMVCSNTKFTSSANTQNKVCPTSENDPNCKTGQCRPVAKWTQNMFSESSNAAIRTNPSSQNSDKGPSGCGRPMARTMTEVWGETVDAVMKAGNGVNKCMGDMNLKGTRSERTCCCWHAQEPVPEVGRTMYYPYVDSDNGEVSGFSDPVDERIAAQNKLDQDKGCASNMHYSTEKSKCVEENKFYNCGSSQKWDEQSQNCISACNVDERWDRASKRCLQTTSQIFDTSTMVA